MSDDEVVEERVVGLTEDKIWIPSKNIYISKPKERIPKKALRDVNIPERYFNATLENEELREVIKDLKTFIEKSQNLLLYGNTIRLKEQACAFLKSIICREVEGHYFTSYDIVGGGNRIMQDDETTVFEYALQVEVLVLDEVNLENISPQVIRLLIQRFDNCKNTVLVTYTKKSVMDFTEITDLLLQKILRTYILINIKDKENGEQKISELKRMLENA